MHSREVSQAFAGYVLCFGCLAVQPVFATAVFHVRSNSLPRIELAGDALDAWPLVNPFVSDLFLVPRGARGAVKGVPQKVK